jgi:hypothetical protein
VLIAALLIAAAAAAPLAADVCTVFCEGTQRATTAVPACHHAAAPDLQIAHGTPGCGYDHARLSRMSIASASKQIAFARADAVHTRGGAVALARTGLTALHAVIRPPGAASPALVAPLRI